MRQKEPTKLSIGEVAQCKIDLLKNNKVKKKLEKLGITENIIKTFRLGLNPNNTSPGTLLIPAYDATKKLITYKYRAIRTGFKWSATGHTNKVLYPLHTFEPGDSLERLYISEGELDCWILWDRKYKNLTTMAGVSTIPDLVKFIPIPYKEVFICLDNQEISRQVAAKIRVLLPESMPVYKIEWGDQRQIGYDVKDFFIKDGHSDEDFENLFVPYDLVEAEMHLDFFDYAAPVEDNPIRLKDGKYWKVKKGRMEPVASFFFKPKERIIDEDDKETILMDLFCDKEVTKIFFGKHDFDTKAAFKNKLSGAKMSVKANENDLQDIMEFVAKRNLPTKKGITRLGITYIDGEVIYACPTEVFAKEGRTDRYTYIDKELQTEKEVKPIVMDEESFKEMLKTFTSHLYSLHEKHTTYSFLAWHFLCYLKPILEGRGMQGGFPILVISGGSGGGKTTLEKIFLKVTGLEKPALFSALLTPFSRDVESNISNSIPFIIDEFKWDLPKDKIAAWQVFARQTYDREIVERGKKDLTLQVWTYRAPFVISGEADFATQQALLERAIIVNPDPNFLRRSGIGKKATTRACQTLESLPLTAFPYYMVQFLNENLNNLFDFLKEAKEIVKAKKDKTIFLSPRIYHNLSLLVLGGKIFEKFVNKYGLKFNSDEFIDPTLQVFFEELQIMQTRGRAKNAFDVFLEMCGSLAFTGRLKKHQSWDFEPPYLYLHFASCYGEFRKYVREIEFRGEVADENAYRRQARTMKKHGEYIDEISWQHYLGEFADSRQMRVMKIDLHKAFKMGLDIEGYGYEPPEKQEEETKEIEDAENQQGDLL